MKKIRINVELAKTAITADEALKLLSTFKDRNKLRLHTFSGFGAILMGCDVDLTSIKARLKKAKAHEIQLAGPNMKRMSHGVGLFERGKGWLFLATNDKKLDAIFKLRGI